MKLHDLLQRRPGRGQLRRLNHIEHIGRVVFELAQEIILWSSADHSAPATSDGTPAFGGQLHHGRRLWREGPRVISLIAMRDIIMAPEHRQAAGLTAPAAPTLQTARGVPNRHTQVLQISSKFRLIVRR